MIKDSNLKYKNDLKLKRSIHVRKNKVIFIIQK